MSQVVPYTKYADDDEEAAKRAQLFQDDDPFPEIPPTLLSSEHIQAYVRQTGMLWPFYPDVKGTLKAASYEVKPGERFIYWDNGRKIIRDIEPGGTYELPANSITFMQIEPKIRLPNYIAIRFNLRIQHVHRGLLLGTGPLVDPGFHGNLLIPLHNLTSDPYTISADEGLIWIEFTKTSRHPKRTNNIGPINLPFKETDPEKTDRPVEVYFEKASGNRPIESSIPVAIAEARAKARSAERDARGARRTNQLFAGIGALATIGAVVGLISFFETMKQNHLGVAERASSAQLDAKEASLETKRLEEEVKALQGRLDALGARNQDDPATLRARLEETSARMRVLEADVKRLSDSLVARRNSRR